MCIIVDANRLGRFLADPVDADAAPIRDWLRRGAGAVVYSTKGTFARELGRSAKDRLAVYARANMARPVPAERLRDDEHALRSKIRSNDAHVLALARETGARLLYTADQDLIADFKDKRLVDQPRGKVYSGSANANLLARSTCARRQK